jgi:hypothetical protein
MQSGAVGPSGAYGTSGTPGSPGTVDAELVSPARLEGTQHVIAQSPQLKLSPLKLDRGDEARGNVARH